MKLLKYNDFNHFIKLFSSSKIVKKNFNCVGMNEKMTGKIGQLMYDPKHIGTGCFGTIVYRGLYSSIWVAVKRVQRIYGEDESTILGEIATMQKAGDHPNILKYIRHEINNDFM